jgi:hypothetical protein
MTTNPSTDWREVVPEGEEAELAKLAAQLGEVQAARHKAAGNHRDRALHAKGHAALRATLTVDSGLPEYARQGLFAHAEQYHAYVRLSNGSGARDSDRVADVRGIAVKVVGVDGDKVLGSARTQDFLAIDAKKIPFRNPREFVALPVAAASGNLVGGLVKQLGLFRTLGLLATAAPTIKGKPNDLLDVTFHTAVPFSFGPYAARLQFVPRHAASPSRGAGSDGDYVGARILDRAAAEPLRWEVQAQFFTNAAETPIEDARVDWPSPYRKLGELVTVPFERNGEGTRALAAFVESLAFDPWHALVAHRPLGAFNRARKHAYFASTKARGAAAEPDGTEWESFGRGTAHAPPTREPRAVEG